MREKYNSPRTPNKNNLTKNDPSSSSNKNITSHYSSKSIPPEFHKYIIQRQTIIQVISIFQWRFQTSMPILRTNSYSFTPQSQYLPQKHQFKFSQKSKYCPKDEPIDCKIENISSFIRSHPETQFYELQVQIQQINLRLSEIELLAFTQALHLLKEMLIGFEALLDIFGNFKAEEEMVAVTINDQWKMWINKDFGSHLKNEVTITEKQFIYDLIIMAERHTLSTLQSRLFFQSAKELTFGNDCCFFKMLEKLNEFVSHNRIYLTNKVIIIKNNEKPEKQRGSCFIPFNSGIKFRKKETSIDKFLTNVRSASSLAPKLDKTVSNCISLFKSGEDKSKNTKTPNISIFNLNHNHNQPRTNTAQNIKAHFTTFHNRNYGQRVSKKINDTTLFHFPTNGNITAFNKIDGKGYQPSNSKVTLPRPRHTLKQLKIDQTKPVSQLNQPPKRPNIRKFSEQLFKMKSLDALIDKRPKFQASTFFNNPPDIEVEVPYSSESIQTQDPLRKEATNGSSSHQELGLNSQNNSSSTKQIANSSENQHHGSKYANMKMKDLAPHRNNKSLINSYSLAKEKDKNMTVSHQFKGDKLQSDSGSEEHKHPQQWVNKISDLFSDNVSIKHLKGSMKFKSNEDQYFEKDHLKNVTLDLLEKFGRNVTLHQEEQQSQFIRPKQHPFRSMQLIEEEIQQAKSYQEEEHDLQSISICSRRQAVRQPDKEISFKDQFLWQCTGKHPPEPQEFNFQTQMYSMRRQ